MFNDHVTYRLVPLKEDKKTPDDTRTGFDAECLQFDRGLARFSFPVKYVTDYRKQQALPEIQTLPVDFEVFAYSNCNILPCKNLAQFGIQGYYKVEKIKR